LLLLLPSRSRSWPPPRRPPPRGGTAAHAPPTTACASVRASPGWRVPRGWIADVPRGAAATRL